MLENTTNQPSKFGIKTWVEINDDSRRTYNVDSSIRFKMSKSSLFDYSNAYILVLLEERLMQRARQAEERDKGVIFKNCALFAKCRSGINNMQKDVAHDIDIVMPMYNLIKYSNNYSKISGNFKAIL